ncbi:Stealth protein CR1, conserved region 1 [Yoonia tamlensis]|uniref:Stealth protein CR1, conserved region 1 n=1 Tax=Yoonia tamlensis TaxID=390270 RepID=A0A1I6FN29_9RHOB|nr:Stealth CR1 domain-containing protein [Yoonia tamlensis]SFR31363.1 Stealth protein CR1, conserved region 1 [Yoonia tamlensis]
MNIDVVIPWVDGADERHRRARLKHIDVGANGGGNDFYVQERSAEIRWKQHGEIQFCLRTIEAFAPWVNKIFLVTDNQRPELTGFSRQFLSKINIIDHTEIFSENLEVLPTFNSATIGSAFWKIQGLSDYFLIFNDDLFFTQPVLPTDFYDDGKPMVRGRYLRLITNVDSDVAWNHHQINSVRMAGVTGRKYFALAHVCQPMRRDLLSDFFSKNPELYLDNIAHRFRHKSQFNLSSLGSQLAIALGEAKLVHAGPEQDWHTLSAVHAQTKRPLFVKRSLKKFHSPEVKMGCVNDIASCSQKVPDAWRILEDILDDSHSS